MDTKYIWELANFKNVDLFHFRVLIKSSKDCLICKDFSKKGMFKTWKRLKITAAFQHANKKKSTPVILNKTFYSQYSILVINTQYFTTLTLKPVDFLLGSLNSPQYTNYNKKSNDTELL